MPKIFSGKRDLYLEVAERYERYIKIGVLKDGDKLPSVRVAAGELGVNPNTVQRAYCYLEERGLIYSLPKKGAFVSDTDERVEHKENHRAEIVKALYSLKEQGITEQEIIDTAREVYADD